MPSLAVSTCLTDLSGRTQAEIDLTLEQEGWGRELFSVMRRAVSSAECGAASLTKEELCRTGK
jgi:hypothetical protein